MTNETTTTMAHAATEQVFTSPVTLQERIESVIGGLQAAGCDLLADNAEELLSPYMDHEQAAAELRELASLLEEHAASQKEAA